ncbi:cadherin domain-containing protein [Verrucomicrobiaceae bacterium N1E253]|uniref:Cadherin domain-containing protein n=1 Tax=Oceaniferula marina TaxID=2748318 RepID=A0A851GBL9_9BACT|nr:cadherin domain-containing protein [Oceaniferula marina]NWK55003.1 cadherin domain-containing protein [Oceaniferula marina]
MAVFPAHASDDNDWWSMGPVGGSFQVQSGTSYIAVREVESGGPADLAGVQVGDFIMGGYGKAFLTTGSSTSGYKGAPQGFANAIERAESSDGAMPLTLLRPGVGSVEVTVNLPVLGSFGPAYPLGSAKFDGIYQQATLKIHENIEGTSNGDVGYMSGFYGIVLLADPHWNDTTGDKPYRLSIDKLRDRAVAVLDAAVVNPVEATNLDGTPNDGSENDSNPNDQSYVSVGLENWGLSTWAMFLAEYRAKTGDTSVDTSVQRAADLLAGRIQTWQQPPYGGSNGPTKVGLMGHGGVGGDYPHIGYSGINIINAHAMTAMAMLKTAGATIDDVKMQASWNWVKSTTNTDGNVGYAWKQGGYDSSGRTAGVAFAMSSYGGLDAADEAVLTTMKDYISREWQRMQHTHAYTVGGTQFYQFVLPYLTDRDQRFIMENQKMFYHFHRTTTDALRYFGGRENNGGDGYVNTGRVAYAGVAMAQAVASGNLTTISSVDRSRIHADFQSPFLTWPTIDARHVEIDALAQAFSVDITDYQGVSILPADYSASWTHISGPATATFTSANTADTTVNFPQDGTYRIQLEVVSGGYTLTEPVDIVVDTSGGPVLTPPSIVTEPTPQSTTLGGSATMSVVVDGDGPFLYEWFLEGKSLGVNSSSTLNLSNVSGGYVGNYQCVVTHPAGTLTSATASLTVTDAGILAQGGLWRDQFDGISGTTVADLTNHSSFPRFSTFAEFLTAAESAREIGDNYGSRWTGWLTPDVTGDYIFYLAADYSSELWLSTDAQPANKVLIHSQVNTLSRDWDAAGQSVAITLTAGQSYYIEVLHKENTGSDYCGVAWQKPGEDVPVDGSEPIPGQYLSCFTGGVHDTSIVLPPVFDRTSYVWTLDETANTGSVVGTVSATDSSTPLTYAITSGNTNGAFTINSSTGEISLVNALDFEVTPSYSLTIQATNSISLIGQVTATVAVNDIYDAQLIVNTNFEDADGFTGYSGHGTLTTNTDNLGAQWSTADDARIWNMSGLAPSGEQCLVLGVVNTSNSVELEIPGTDHGVSSVTFDYAAFSSSTNATTKLYYRVDGGAWVEAWSVTMNGMVPDWQVKPWPWVTVDINQAGDVDLKFETTGTKGILIDTIRVKDNRPNLPPVANDSSLSIFETVDIGTSVGIVDGSDPNAGDPLSYAITGGNTGNAFAIHATTGEITLVSSLDYDVQSQYQLSVSVTDTLGLSDTATVTINVDPNLIGLVDIFYGNEIYDGVSYVNGWSEVTGGHVSESLNGTELNRNQDSGNGATWLEGVSSSTDAATTTWNTANHGDWTWEARIRVHDSPNGFALWLGTGLGVAIVEIYNDRTQDSGNQTFNVAHTNNDGAYHVWRVANDSAASKYHVWRDGVLLTPVGGVGYDSTSDDDRMIIGDTTSGTFGNSHHIDIDYIAYDQSGVYSPPVNNSAPAWNTHPVNEIAAMEDAAFSATLSDDVSDADSDPLSFSKVSGPAWLAINSDGTLSGVPANSDVGNNSWIIEVSDGTASPVQATLNITVINSNDPPLVNDHSASITENVANGTAVVTVAASDPDVGDSLTYAITAGNIGGAFAIDTNGSITTAAAIDYESVSSYSLTVTVTDSSSATDEATVTVTVTNENEAPSAVDNSASVQDDLTIGASVVTVVASDPDTGDSLSYAITAGNTGGAFAIDSSGIITTTTTLDAATTSSYTLTVTVTDSGNLTDIATVSIAVTAANNDPVFVSDPIIGGEGMLFVAYTGTLAGSASDADAGDNLTYSKISGPAWLSIAADGTLTGTPTSTDGGLNTFTVEVSDGNGGSAQAVLTITVAEAGVVYFDDFESYDVENPSDFSVGGTASGNWTASNTASNATRTFNTSNYGGSRLWISNVDGTRITSDGIEVGADAHYTMSVVMLTETATAGRTLNANYDILVGQDAASAVSIVGGPQAVVTEGDDWQTPDSKSDHVFTHSFQTGTLNPGDKVFLRYERVGTLSSGGWFGVDDVQLTLDGRNSAPTVNDDTFTVAENAGPGIAVGTVSASDPNVNDTLVYSITAGNAGGEFTIDAQSGAMTTTSPLDYEMTGSYALTVTVTDGGGVADTADITVNVSDVNEAPVAADSSGSLTEDSMIGAAVATVAASDVDAGDSLSFAITAGNTGNAFAIDSSGNITTTTPLDYETQSSYTLTVTVTDTGLLTDTATVDVTVTDVVETTAPVVSTGSAGNFTQTSADLSYTVSDDGGEAPTVTLYYGETDGGTTPGNWASSAGQGVRAIGGHTASLSGLTEGTTYYFTVHASNSAGEVWGSSGSFTTEADTSPKLVRTTISGVTNGSWTTVNLGQSYNSAVIIATPIYPDTTTAPVVTRITNVSGSSFDLKVDRADGLSDAMTIDVSIIAVEEGVYTQATDGVTMEAVKYTSTVTADNNSWVGEAQTYQNTYTAPVVVGQVMSANDANWSVFWSMGNSRTVPASASALNVGKHVGEDPNTTRANETIGYIVIESGSGTINGVAYEAALGGDSVRGFGNSSSPYTYTLSGGLSTVSSAAASISGMDGGNGAWAVLSGSPALTTTSIGLHALEDQLNDSELSHTTTQVGYIVFE